MIQEETEGADQNVLTKSIALSYSTCIGLSRGLSLNLNFILMKEWRNISIKWYSLWKSRTTACFRFREIRSFYLWIYILFNMWMPRCNNLGISYWLASVYPTTIIFLFLFSFYNNYNAQQSFTISNQNFNFLFFHYDETE